MRPARKGPENTAAGQPLVEQEPPPSMRPARKGPENLDLGAGRPHRRTPFNEAGPQGAGKRFAGPAAVVEIEPSMRPARKGPENDRPRECGRRRDGPSMRPARKGPENRLLPRPALPADAGLQ